MRLILLIALLFSATQIGFSQTTPSKKQVKKAVKAVKKGECVLIYYNEMLASNFEKKQIKHVKTLFELDEKTVNELFFKETNIKLRVTLFYILCSKYRSEITEKHFEALTGNQEVSMCSGRNTDTAPLEEMVAYFYENSVPRKEKINDPKALELLQEAQNLWYASPVDFEKMIALLNEADKLEPNNPIILDARGDALFNSDIDKDGGMEDFQNAINYSLDEKALEIRYNNRGLTYQTLGDIDKACEDWQKGGKYSETYIEDYCNQVFDTVIHENPDNNVVLEFKLPDDTLFLRSPSSMEMTFGFESELVIKNQSESAIKIANGNLNLALEGMNEVLYLEAILEDGKKFRFFTDSQIEFFDGEEARVISPGKSDTTFHDIIYIHSFAAPGKYKVRIAFRPTKNVSGLAATYYSNWEELTVVKYTEKPE